jgi:hypothetical protein
MLFGYLYIQDVYTNGEVHNAINQNQDFQKQPDPSRPPA